MKPATGYANPAPFRPSATGPLGRRDTGISPAVLGSSRTCARPSGHGRSVALLVFMTWLGAGCLLGENSNPGNQTPQSRLATGAETASAAARLYAQAETAFRSRNLGSAAVLLHDALALDPRNAIFRFSFGLVALQRGDQAVAKDNFEFVSRARPERARGVDYCTRLAAHKQRIRELQAEFTKEAQRALAQSTKGTSGGDPVRTARGLFQAFRLCPPLAPRHAAELKSAISTYETALKDEFANQRWQRVPMLQLAYLYEVSRRTEQAQRIYMMALDNTEDPVDLELITERFDILNRPSQDRLLDLIEDGTFGRKDIQELMGSESARLTDAETGRIDAMIADFRARLEKTETAEERKAILDELKSRIAEEQSKGLLPSKDKLNKRLEQEGKNIDDLLNEAK